MSASSLREGCKGDLRHWPYTINVSPLDQPAVLVIRWYVQRTMHPRYDRYLMIHYKDIMDRVQVLGIIIASTEKP